MGNMYSNFSSIYPTNYNSGVQNSGNSDDRLIGGFAFPFLLGGVTGAAIAPAFWRPPYNGSFYGPYYRPYGPYYGSYRPF